MPPISDWADLMSEEVTIEESAGRDMYGTPMYGTPATYKAHLSYRRTRVRTADGAEVYSTLSVWLNTTDTIDAHDRITLPDGTTPQIIAVERSYDEKGLHHVKVLCG